MPPLLGANVQPAVPDSNWGLVTNWLKFPSPRKGDAMRNQFLIDYKHCEKSHTVSVVNWRKLAKDAWNEHYKHPLLCLVLGENSQHKLAVIEWPVFLELVEGSDYE